MKEKRTIDKKICRKILSVLMGIAMIFTAIPVGPGYAGETIVPPPTISVSETSTYQGSSGTVYVRAGDFANIGALKIIAVYDTSAITVTSAYNGTLVSGSPSDVNYSESGFVKQSLASDSGISGNGTLLYFNYKVKETAEPGEYPITILVEEACDTNGNSITITKQSGKITVMKRSQSTATANFTTQLSKSNLREGDTFEYSLYSYGIGNLAGGNFEFTYDRDVLELTNVQFETPLQKGTSSINKNIAGYVKVSYAGTEAIATKYSEKLVTLSFKVKKDETLTSDIVFSPSELRDVELQPMNGNGKTVSIRVTKHDVELPKPQFRLEYQELVHGETYQVTAIAAGDSGLAAGDFVITYDSEYSLCTALEADPSVGEKGGYVVTNEKKDGGQIKFSFVNSSGISEEQRLVVMTFKRLKVGGKSNMDASCKEPVDKDFKLITFDYPVLEIDMSHYLKDWEITTEPGCETTGVEKRICTGCDYEISRAVPMLGHEFETDWTVDKEATCSQSGLKSHHCTRCDAVRDVTELPRLAHTEVIDSALEPTCTESGLTEGKHCSVCNDVLVAQTEVAALGHDFVHHEGKTATCTEAGWEAYDTCTRCDHTTYKEIQAKGHTEVTDSAKDATCTETGLTEGKHCSVCNEILIAQETIPALGHNLKETKAIPETCTTNGNTAYYTCERCNKYFSDANGTTEIEKDSWILAAHHTWEETYTVDKPATCTETGSESIHCSRCDATKDARTIPAKGHTYSQEWTIDEPATTTTTGSKSHHCIWCDEKTDITPIPILKEQDIYLSIQIKGMPGEGVLAIYPLNTDHNNIETELKGNAEDSSILRLTGMEDNIGIYKGKLPEGTYLAVAYNADWECVYQEIRVDGSGESRGILAQFLYGDTTESGIKIHSFIYGDVDDNGKVDFADVLYAKRHIANWSGYDAVNRFALDVDCDGDVGIDDVNIVARYIAGWKKYETIPYKGA